eukprot:5690084-Pleurochrysis_carterae.AAC.1
MSASMSSRFAGGHRSARSAREICRPSAVTGSPTTTFAGAACSPTRASPATASCACTYARVPAPAGSLPAARVCTGSMCTSATSAGVGT